jgi:hypothetical protein
MKGGSRLHSHSPWYSTSNIHRQPPTRPPPQQQPPPPLPTYSHTATRATSPTCISSARTFISLHLPEDPTLHLPPPHSSQWSPQLSQDSSSALQPWHCSSLVSLESCTSLTPNTDPAQPRCLLPLGTRSTFCPPRRPTVILPSLVCSATVSRVQPVRPEIWATTSRSQEPGEWSCSCAGRREPPADTL